jgi:F-type H+-transporting ATPase subunit b
MSKAAEARNREVSEKLAAQIKAGEDKIAVARADAMAQVKEIAAGAAAAVAGKLVGLSVDDATAQAAVRSVAQEGIQ